MWCRCRGLEAAFDLHCLSLQSMEQSQQDNRQHTIARSVEHSKRTQQLPEDSNVFVAPSNNTTKPMEKVQLPPDLHEREATFYRCVAMVLGLPGGGGQVCLPWWLLWAALGHCAHAFLHSRDGSTGPWEIEHPRGTRAPRCLGGRWWTAA